jgi:hypothetical protein
VGLYFSVKNGRHMPFESSLELQDLWRAEVDTAVVRSFVQPLTLQLACDGERWRYTPDRQDVLAYGAERLVEVKDDDWARSDPQLAARLEQAGRELECVGTPLHIHTRREIQAEPRLSAIAEVQRHRRTAVSAAEQVRVEDQLDRREVTLGELQRCIGGGVHASAVLCALMVRRAIAIDLAAGLHEDALVRSAG